MRAMNSPPTSLPQHELHLQVPGFTWGDLQAHEGLARLHEVFLTELAKAAPEAATRLARYRACQGVGMAPQEISDVLLEVAPFVSGFVAHLFGASSDRAKAISHAGNVSPIFRMKDQLVKRRALKHGRIPHDECLDRIARRMLRAVGARNLDDELEIALVACELMDLEAELKKADARPDAVASLRQKLGEDAGELEDRKLVAFFLVTLEKWLMMRRGDPALRPWMSFRQPRPLHFERLVEIRRTRPDLPELLEGPPEHRRNRDGFALTDRRGSVLEVQNEVDYCLYCHGRDKDSCSKGLRDKDGNVKANPLGVALHGCPLGEKISEAHLLTKGGDSIAALAVIAVDNPMAPGTGHRICNDCMKACVFQKQDPVNIPMVETGILTDVLSLPWGFEIYGLLTRWNPLNVRRPYPLPYHGKNVLVVGLGPAGYTLAHHLLNEGFGVVGVDGLKLEPLPLELLSRPIRDIRNHFDDLEERKLLGFGGVSEYGITVRWDKNFLFVVYLTLARREKVRFHGGVRFGGTLTLQDAWDLGFHHVAIAAGAGKPTIIDLENNLIRGIRKASDFLMALQLTGAFKKNTLVNLQVRLPALVVGGGLTAIDTATELRAYYVVQVEKILSRFERLVAEEGEAKVRSRYDREENEILDEFLRHGRAIRAEKSKALAEGREPNLHHLIDSWGGVTLVYRKRLEDSPAYRLNHEEVEKCLEEGVRFLENLLPKAANPDEHGALKSLTLARPSGELVELPVRTLCVAAGTAPNTTYEREYPGTFQLDEKGFFLPHRAIVDGNGKVRVERGEGFFTSYLDDAGHTVSYYGDNHPKYAGSVVKAMASAKHGYLHVKGIFERDIEAALVDRASAPAREASWQELVTRLEDQVRAVVVAVNRLTPNIVEVVVRAPLAAKKFCPGQFYRLQNFESDALEVDGTPLVMEGLALTGAWTDPERGLLSLIVLEMGGSSRLCAALRKGEPVLVMGPTGTPTEIPRGETVLLAGGGLGNAVLFSIAKALRAVGCTVVYFAGYKQPSDVFKREEIEASTHQVIWASDVGPLIEARRPQDRSIVGNIVAAMVAYARGELGAPLVKLSTVDRIIAIGSDRMMAAVASARHGMLAPYLKREHVGIGSINSPMQCMMKEVCAQCLQKHVDPTTGKTDVIFSCFNQDQHLDRVDWKNLNDRLRQNTVQEKLSSLWLDRLLKMNPDVLAV
ncbi:MAG: FAD-dependent oxidoreductase [Deltaproteobacteria bacterium]|nr:FAD-dependent oxidoreductase [Deltaproteobacteria bacterium]